MKKSDLPQKICATCQRPFTWRKKWEKNWAEVKYCSKRCRGNKAKGGLQTDYNSSQLRHLSRKLSS